MAVRLSKSAAAKMGLKAPAKRHKYNAKPTVVDGIRFASAKEARRYGELKALVEAGQISALGMQPTFTLCAKNGDPICRYKGDFSYREHGQTVVEDVKGLKTPLYLLKKKWLKADYGIDVREV